MSEENPDVDVIVINDESETTAVTKSPSAVTSNTTPDSENSNAASNSDSPNILAHETITITLSSDSESPALSPDPATAKGSDVSDVSKIKPVTHTSEETYSIDKNKEDNIVEETDEKPTIEMIEQNLATKKTIEENPGVEMIEENPRNEMIEENPGVEMIEENPGIETMDENPGVEMIEENPGIETMDKNPRIKMIEENTGIEMIDENPEMEMIDENPGIEMIENPEIPDENLSDISDTSINSDDVSEGNDLDISDPPVFDLEDEENSSTPSDASRIELLDFYLKSYSVPDSERYGNCRLITEFEKISYVGRGSFGVVYKVLDVKNEIIVALKKMKISMRDKDPLTTNIMREINLLRDLEHPNIMNTRGIAVGRNFDSTYLILDCCDYDLAKVIDDEKSSAMLEEPQRKSIMSQLFEGLKFIHKNGIIHRDLSCSNVLFTFEGILKIGDFGLSRTMTLEKPMTPNIGSRWYRSLELLFGSTYYSLAVDLWSAGCIFAEVILKKPLFKAKTDMDVISLIIDILGSPDETTWPGCSELPVLQLYELRNQPKNRLKSLFAEQSEACLDLLNKLLTFDPKQRINAIAAFSHPYFSEDPPACSPGDLIPILEITDEIETQRQDKSEDEAEESDMNTEESVNQ